MKNTFLKTNTKHNNIANSLHNINNLKIKFIHTKSEEWNKYNHLDILARVLTNGYSKSKADVCVAVCLHEQKLFIASNKKKPDYAKDCLEDLHELIKNQSIESYQKLLKKAVEKIMYIKLKSKSNNIIKEFKEKAKECYESKNPDWSNLQAIAKKLFQEIKNTSKNDSIINQMWKFLMPWHDVGELVRLILEKNFDEVTKISIEQYKKKIVYVEDENDEKNSNKETPVHAEIKIINKLYRKKNKQIQEIKYIGCTKKSCIHCRAIIEILNEIGKYLWVSYGTHYGTRIKSKNPDIVIKLNKEDDVKKKIEEIISRGVLPCNSTTSEIPESLTNPLKLLEKLRLENKNIV